MQSSISVRTILRDPGIRSLLRLILEDAAVDRHDLSLSISADYLTITIIRSILLILETEISYNEAGRRRIFWRYLPWCWCQW